MGQAMVENGKLLASFAKKTHTIFHQKKHPGIQIIPFHGVRVFGDVFLGLIF